MHFLGQYESKLAYDNNLLEYVRNVKKLRKIYKIYQNVLTLSIPKVFTLTPKVPQSKLAYDNKFKFVGVLSEKLIKS